MPTDVSVLLNQLKTWLERVERAEEGSSARAQAYEHVDRLETQILDDIGYIPCEYKTENARKHEICASPDRWPECDAQGIFLTFVCEHCEKIKLSRYRPEILEGYTQADVDEPIEPEEDVPNY
jgi:hypothetical protein